MTFDVNGGNRAKIPVVGAFTLRKLTWLFSNEEYLYIFQLFISILISGNLVARICFTLIDPDQIHTYVYFIN